MILKVMILYISADVAEVIKLRPAPSLHCAFQYVNISDFVYSAGGDSIRTADKHEGII